MSKLDRDSLANGAFVQSFKDAPGIEWWSEERIEASMRETLARRPSDGPVWLFAYGSLIWNPLIHYQESCPASLDGWRRSFCIRLLIARGSVEQPGRMMALAPGGATQGLAFMLADARLEQELKLVWMREMAGGAYRPGWAIVALGDGRLVQAIIFTADGTDALYEPDDSVDTIAPLIASARGSLGSNRDYLAQLDGALRRHGIVDDYIRELAARVNRDGA